MQITIKRSDICIMGSIFAFIAGAYFSDVNAESLSTTLTAIGVFGTIYWIFRDWD